MNGDNPTVNNSSSGSLIGSIIVVIILIVGAVYLFSQKATAPETLTAPTDNPEEVTTPKAPITQESLDMAAEDISAEADKLSQDLETLNAGL
ncbi:hypothetical protein IT398_02955 [Candidatus Nomurabacteria bacterium]|nr:hypothetical protein [Candidatus Nomurabacteria bacterium]